MWNGGYESAYNAMIIKKARAHASTCTYDRHTRLPSVFDLETGLHMRS